MAKKSIFDVLKQKASQVYDQINPLDNGLTYSQRTPTSNKSALNQGVGGTKSVVGSIVKPLAQFPLDVGTLGYNKLIAPTFNLPQQNIQTNPYIGSQARAVGANGSVKQAVGSGIQTALTLGSGGLDNLAENAASRVLPKTIPNIIARMAPHVATGAIAGGGFNAGSGISEGHTAKQVLTRDLPIGAAVGAALPIAGEAARSGGRVTTKGAKNAVNTYKASDLGQNQSGKILLRDGSEDNVPSANAYGKSIKLSSENGYEAVPTTVEGTDGKPVNIYRKSQQTSTNVKGNNYKTDYWYNADGTKLTAAQADAAIKGNAVMAGGRKSTVGTQPIEPVSNPVPVKTSSPVSTIKTSGERPIINTERYDITPGAKTGLQDEALAQSAEIKAAKGQPLTFKEIAAQAKVGNKSYQTVKTREQTLESAAKIKGSRDIVAELAEKRNSGEALSSNEQQTFVKQIAVAASHAADAGRKLNSFKIKADPADQDAIGSAIKDLVKKGHDLQMLMDRAKQFDLNDPKQLATLYREFEKATKEDWLDKLRYSSMLSSPVTHIRNIAANTVGGTVVAPATKLVAGGVDALRSAVTGGERKRFAGEAGAYSKGYASNLQDAFKAFGDVMSGRSISKNPDVNLSATLPLSTKGASGVLDSVLGVTGKLMEAADQFGNKLATGGERAALKYREGKGVGVSGLETKAHDAAQYQLFRGELGGDAQGHLLNGIDFLANKILEARTNKNPLVRVTAKLAAPFVKTPTNISKQMIEYSPLGLLTTIGAEDKTNQIAKAITGTVAVGTAGAALAAHDALTFSAPTDPNERARFYGEHKQPYSVKIGGHWVSYQYLHPAISFELASIASVKNALDSGKIDDSTADKILTGLRNASTFFIDQSYFKNGQDFVNNLQGKSSNVFSTATSDVASNAANTASQIIPFRALATWIDNMTDPTQRKTDFNASFIQQFKQDIEKQTPGLSQNVAPLTDAGGNPIQKQHPVLNAFSPAKVSTDTGGKLSDIFAPGGGNAAKQVAYSNAGLTGKDATRFLQMTSAQQHDAALKDPTMKQFYDIKQTVDTHNHPDLVLPTGIDQQSADTLNQFNRLTSSEKQQLYASNPAAKYHYDEAVYQRDKALGNYTKVEQATKEKTLEKESVGSNYSQDTRDLYSMSLSNLADYLNSNPDPQAANDLQDYDQALLDAGVISKSKFATYAPGQAPASGGSSKKKISVPSSGSVAKAHAAPAGKIKTSSSSGGKVSVAVKARQHGKSGKGTLKIKRG